MEHLERIRSEFGRQAETFDAWAVKTDEKVETRFREALGAAGAGTLLDVACGPGVVSAALAPTARAVTAFDATAEMLDKARHRCAEAGLDNISFRQGDAEALPFADGAFDGVVTRLAIHHFAAPARALAEMYRVLRPGGSVVIADVVASEDSAEAALQNAIERLRDPSHTRMLSASELDDAVTAAGFHDLEASTWDKRREFEEWMAITGEESRVAPLRTVVRALAEAGRSAGFGLSVVEDRIVFFHRWRMIKARKPAG